MKILNSLFLSVFIILFFILAAFLQESDMFMDALTASATNKKEPKKRKRRTSVTKDTTSTTNPPPVSTSPPTSPTVTNSTMSPLSSPVALKAIAPKFYKDTLETDDTKPTETEDTKTEIKEEQDVEKTEEKEEENENVLTENVVKEIDGLRGVLVYHKRKGPKKSVKWRGDSELEEVKYFELDETERVNVTKTFTDMKQMEHVGEREALQLSRKVPNEDLMDERTTWKPLVPLDLPPPLAESGSKSLEKSIQFAREKVVLQALYFNRTMLPESAAEPDVEHHHVTDPAIIPLEDVTGNPDSVNDYQNTPWPEPKGSPPHNNLNSIPNVPTNMFSGGIPPFNPNPIGPPNFPGMPQQFAGPGFGPNMMGGDWRNMGDGSVMQSEAMNHGPVNPTIFNNRPDGYMMDEGNFPPGNFGPGPGPMGPGPIYQNFMGNRGNNRGGYRNMNRGGWFRPSGPPPGWHGPRGGSGNHWGGRGGGAGICKQYKMQGFCRNRDSCPYMHPQNNGPY